MSERRTIVFFSIPAHGHTNPTLEVVRALTARGHRVWYYSYEPFRAQIEAAGGSFIPCEQFDAERRLSPGQAARVGRDVALSTRVLVDTTLALDEAVCAEMARLQPDCIVADSMAVWGRLAAQKLGVPFVSSTTTFAFNKESARILKQSPAQAVSMVLGLPRIQKDVARLQAAGYPVRSILDIIANDENTHTIVYTSPQFQPAAESFSDKFAFVGPSVRPAEQPFAKRREKQVYLSMGTVNNALLPLYKRCLRAVAGSGWQVVLSVGQQVDPAALGPLPDGVEVYPRVDQIAVLQKADAFLTHCGMNSVSEALYCGVPLVLLPQTAEQGGVAARAEQLGAGLRLKKSTPGAIRAALERVLADPAYRANAAAVGAGFRACPGAEGAAEKILAVCGSSAETAE